MSSEYTKTNTSSSDETKKLLNELHNIQRMHPTSTRTQNNDSFDTGMNVCCGVCAGLFVSILYFVLLGITIANENKIMCIPESRSEHSTPSFAPPPSPSNETTFLTTTKTATETPSSPSENHDRLISFSVTTWAIVEAILGLVGAFFTIIMVSAKIVSTSDNSDNLGVCCVLCSPCAVFYLYLYDAFHFTWIIVGAIQLWNDCPDLAPKEFHNMYTAQIIISLVCIGFLIWSKLKLKKN
jgi:hypothetical protein